MGFVLTHERGYYWLNNDLDDGSIQNSSNLLMELLNDGSLSLPYFFLYNSTEGTLGLGNFSENPPFFNVSFSGKGIHIKNEDPTLLLDQDGGSLIGIEAGVSSKYILSSHDRLGGKTTLYKIANDGTHEFDGTAKINVSAQRLELGDSSIGDTSEITLIGANGLQESTMIGFYEDSRRNNGIELHYDSSDNELHFMDWTGGVVDTSPRITIDRNNDAIGINKNNPQEDLDVNGGIRISDSSSCLMLRDTDDAGWTKCTALNGVLSCSIDADGIC